MIAIIRGLLGYVAALFHSGPRRVHILKNGRALCGVNTIPGQWPGDDKWIGFDDLEDLPLANCQSCIAAHPSATGKAER